jgi:poly(3-hydroxybutyrate) depolymerase
MKTFGSILTCLLAGVASITAQSNVRAHYASGQVWVVWDVQDAVLNNCVPTLTPALSNGVPVVVSNCLPATYAIYWSENPVTNTTTANLVGRLFAQEWSGSILRNNVQASFGSAPTGFRIPDGAGGYRVLATNEGLFVHTARSNFAGHYAVRPFGVTNVPAAWRAPLTNAVFSLADPPTCHLQARGTNQGYPVEWWTMWVDGDTNLAAARPDFPIMENDKRRGIPHNFSVTMPSSGSLPATNIPACVAFHSGDGQAKMWLPENNGFKSIGLAPAGGLLIAVEDRFFSTKNGVVDAESITAPGYVTSFDPFFDHQVGSVLASPPEKLPASDEVVVPYPLYRLNWTLDWLYAHKNVDSNRVALVGHSGGGKGSLLWSHASPERFAYVGLYNPALGGPPFSPGSVRQIGTLAQNLPLLLTNRSGQLVRVADTHEFAASFSPLRDLPFTRLFHGKREENWALDGDQDGLSDLIQTFQQADALGLGAASFWDLRRHGMDTWTYATLSNDVAHPNNCGANPTVDISASWGVEDLWVPTLATQFRRDDATNQIRHRADRSYPAFFNCAGHAGHEDVGSVIYANNSGPYLDNARYDGLVTTTECLPPWIGDARGTFGGYFDWEPNIIDTATNWSAVLFLVGPPSAFNPVEVCPAPLRFADIAIRRPQQFQPLNGTRLDWRLENAATSALITNGTVLAGVDNLVSVPGLPIPRDPVRARLTVSVVDSPSNGCFSCTQVIGYSQVGALNGWFTRDGVFESIVGTDHWQLLWNNGATLEHWQDPNYFGWNNALVSPCASNSAAPDRVVLNLAGFYESNVVAWVDAINATIGTTIVKLPGVRRIVLQPVIGGPGHQLCTNGAQVVQASESHPYIDEAIAIVVAARAGTQPEVVAGISPEVRDCSEYADGLGHLTHSGAVAAAGVIGNYYAALDAACLAPPPPPCLTPVLSIRPLTNGLMELSWPSCPLNFYQVEWTRTFQNWQWLTPPLAAPLTNGTMTWTTPVSPPCQFFRLVVWPLTNSPVPTAPGVYGGLRLEHGGVVRNYRLNLPANYTGAEPAPLMLALHGHNQTADEFAGNQPALANYANALGVILVFPDGTASARGTGWNAQGAASGDPIDDVGFLLALIDELDDTLNIDRKRVYAGGFSNGGQMCHHLGSATTNVFAALAAVGSAIASDLGTGTLLYQPPPSQPMPVFIVNATNDCKRPFWGGLNEDGSLQAPAFDQVVHWTNGNACPPSPVITTNIVVTNHVRRVFADSCAGPYPAFNAPTTNHVIREHYQLTCTPGSEVLFVTLTDGGHKWPEANDNVGFDASREVLEFFLRHCRCDAIGAADPLVIPTAPGRYDLRVCDQNYSRLFRLQVPPGYVAANATPIVFAMHGGGQTMVEFATQHPALFAKANAENILLVLPEALDHPQTRDTLWMNKPFDYVVDDRVFFTNLLEHIAAALNVDRKRVYACGFSGGGSFSHWLAATTPGLLAAIAPVCTQTGWNEPDANGPIVAPPAPLEYIPVLMVRGTLDSKRPFNGGLNIDGVECRSAGDDTAYWTAGNACVGAPVITSAGNLMRWEYTACAGTTEVVLVAVGGMDHLWPDAADGVGYDANVSVVDFLLRHTRP